MKRILFAVFACTICCSLAFSSFPQQQSYDLLITGGRILDGTGNPWFSADIAIKDGKIAAIGKLAGAPVERLTRRVIDARGHYVAPGFIDIHSHADEGLGSTRTNASPNKITQGVTTEVVNQDGRSPVWPLSKQRALYEKQGVGVNAILMIGHGTIRAAAMKNDYRRLATTSEIEEMKKLAQHGMEDGAFGLSAGLEYVPGRWSDTRELIEIAKAIAPYQAVYISHERSEGRDPMWKNASDPTPSVDLLQAVKETIEIGEKSGVTVVASHLKAKGAIFWGSGFAATRLIAEARERGVPVYADCSDGGIVAQGQGIPHPRYYGTFARKLRHYALDRKVISLPFAIRSMTSLPAQILGLKDRGLLRENYWADVAIFDPEKVRDLATYVNPHQYAEGVPYVLVNGDLVVDDGKITGKLPGKVLTRSSR